MTECFHCAVAGRRLERSGASAAGFTYIGLLLLVAMMGVALTVVSQTWQTVQKRDKEAELMFIGDQMRRALALYAANATGAQRFPQSLQDLLKDTRYSVPRRYLRKIYADPFTGRAEWGLVKGPGDVIMGVHSLSEEVPLKKSGFRRVDQAFAGKTKYAEWIFMPATVVPQAGAAQPLPGGVTPSMIR